MSIFLEKFQQENAEKIHIIQLDNAPIHICVAGRGAQSLWFIDLDDVKEKVAQIFNSLEQDIIIA